MLNDATATVEDKRASLKGSSFDLEAIVPLELIREHTKTDDIMSVTDSMLTLYRKAALEAAERYTGLLFTAQKVIAEPVMQPGSFYEAPARYFSHKTQFPFAQTFAYLYGDPSRQSEQVTVSIGSRVALIAYHPGDMGMGCCNPNRDKGQLMLQYAAGYGCENDLPSAVALGVLKYVAHVINNAGDSIRRQDSEGTRNRTVATILEANNPALASGAIDIWRVIKDDAL